MSAGRFYRKLNLNPDYIQQHLKRVNVTILTKARCDLLNLNANKFGINVKLAVNTKTKINSISLENVLAFEK